MNGTFYISDALKTEHPELEERLQELPVQFFFEHMTFRAPVTLTSDTIPYEVTKTAEQAQPTFQLMPLCHPYYSPGKLRFDPWVTSNPFLDAAKKQFVLDYKGWTFAIRTDGLDYASADKVDQSTKQ